MTRDFDGLLAEHLRLKKDLANYMRLAHDEAALAGTLIASLQRVTRASTLGVAQRAAKAALSDSRLGGLAMLTCGAAPWQI